MPIKPEIASHVQRHILPLYATFDRAHGPEHVHKVIQNSLSIAEGYGVDMDKVYVIAAYHDAGLSQGRENHEKTSAAFLLADGALRAWFSQEDLQLMAQAVEDHRASNDHEPRSIYGKIVSEADRDIEYVTILTRTIQYSLKHYPGYTLKQHFDRTYAHMQDKYGEQGYLKLWLDTEANRRNLLELRHMLAAPEKLQADFEKIFDVHKN